jgi:hypothetical protein
MAKKSSGGGSTTKIGRDASSGRFITVKEARSRPKTAIVETIKFKGGAKPSDPPPTRKKR